MKTKSNNDNRTVLGFKWLLVSKISSASDYFKGCNITLICNYGLKFQQYVINAFRITSEQVTWFSQVSSLLTVANLC